MVAVPLRRDDAVKVFAACGDDALGRRDAALISVMREAMLRGIEAAALEWGDIDVMGDGWAAVMFRTSKTDQSGRHRTALSVSPLCLHRLELWRPDAPTIRVFGLSARSVAYVVRASGGACRC